MAFRNGAYAKIQEILDTKDKYKDVRITTSRKNKITGKYEYDFSSKVRLIGEANLIPILKEDTIKVIDCEISNKYDKEKKITYWNPIIWNFEKIEKAADKQVAISEDLGKEDSDEDLPF